MDRRTRVLLAALVALTGGCGPEDAPPGASGTPGGDSTATAAAGTAGPTATPAPTAPAGTPPASAAAPPSPGLRASDAGGACHLVDFATIYEHLGLSFDISAARERDDAYTCVVRAIATDLPDLTLTVVATSTDVEGFGTDLRPAEAEELERLGQVGYAAPVEPDDEERGPGLEVVWLSGDGKLLRLVLTLPTDASDSEEYVDELVDLARAIDRRRI